MTKQLTNLDDTSAGLDRRPADAPPAGALDSLDSLDDSLELQERQALRRVPGLATDLVGVWTSGTLTEAENSLAGLARLAETAGSQVLEGRIQRRDRPDPATYLGSG